MLILKTTILIILDTILILITTRNLPSKKYNHITTFLPLINTLVRRIEGGVLRYYKNTRDTPRGMIDLTDGNTQVKQVQSTKFAFPIQINVSEWSLTCCAWWVWWNDEFGVFVAMATLLMLVLYVIA